MWQLMASELVLLVKSQAESRLFSESPYYCLLQHLGISFLPFLPLDGEHREGRNLFSFFFVFPAARLGMTYRNQ